MNRITDLPEENKFHSVGCSSANNSTLITTVIYPDKLFLQS